MIGIIISIISIIISIIVIIDVKKSSTRRASDEIQRYKDNEFQKEKDIYLKKLDKDFEDLKNNQYNKLKIIENEINNKKEFNESIKKIREDELNRLIDSQRKIKEEELNKLIEEKEKHAEELISLEVEEWAQSAQEAANFEQVERMEALDKLYNDAKEELTKVIDLLNEYKEKRDAINQQILRERALEEKQDFYRIQLDDSSKEDIEILNSIRQRLNKTDLLDKLIYDNYIARPAKEMTKRVLEGKNPSGIYKVTNIKTNEIYIGKSIKVADRVINHIKSACGLEGVAESQFQRALKKYGVDCFTWELLEECPKENLTTKEKSYIIFYGTKEYGYNQREG